MKKKKKEESKQNIIIDEFYLEAIKELDELLNQHDYPEVVKKYGEQLKKEEEKLKIVLNTEKEINDIINGKKINQKDIIHNYNLIDNYIFKMKCPNCSEIVQLKRYDMFSSFEFKILLKCNCGFYIEKTYDCEFSQVKYFPKILDDFSYLLKKEKKSKND